jgi:hypothetical protein
MRKALIGLLLASLAITPALAGKDGGGKRGHGHGKKWHKVDRQGPGDRGGWNQGRDWDRRPVRIARADRDDDDDDDRWERRRGAHREWREVQRPVERVVRHAPAPRYVQRYAKRPVRYLDRSTRYSPTVRYAEPVTRYVQSDFRYGPADRGYGSFDDIGGYAPVSYAPAALSGGLFGGGGNGVLGALLPILLSGALGGSGLGDLGGLGLTSPTVLPLDQLGYGAPLDAGFSGPLATGYAPASYSDFAGGLSSLF